MRVVLAAILVTSALSNDKQYCSNQCAEKYPEGENRDACRVGCDERVAASFGPFGFIECQRGCDNKFSREEGKSSNTHAACSYACLLPTTSSVFMSVKYVGDGKPDVKIVSNNNGVTKIERPSFSSSSDIDRFFSNVFGDVNRISPWRNTLDFSKSIFDELNGNSSSDRSSGTSLVDQAQSRMMAVQQHLDDMLSTFSKQFFENVRRHTHGSRNHAIERPSDHEAFSHIGPEVGNLLSNGKPIIVTHPVGSDSDFNGHPTKVVHYQMTPNHPPSTFYWIMIVFGVGALLLTIYASVIFFRVMRSAAYRRISAETVLSRCHVGQAGPGAVPVKKVPVDGWVEHTEPSGVPPPAYDQVSIHSVQNQQKPDASSKGDVALTQTAGSSSNDRK